MFVGSKPQKTPQPNFCGVRIIGPGHSDPYGIGAYARSTVNFTERVAAVKSPVRLVCFE